MLHAQTVNYILKTDCPCQYLSWITRDLWLRHSQQVPDRQLTAPPILTSLGLRPIWKLVLLLITSVTFGSILFQEERRNLCTILQLVTLLFLHVHVYGINTTEHAVSSTYSSTYKNVNVLSVTDHPGVRKWPPAI